MQELEDIIGQIELFHGLNAAQHRKLAAIALREEHQRGDTIIEQDAPGDSMYVIAQGQVEVRKRDFAGNARTMLFLGEGQVFGELALLDQGLRTATIVADEDETILYCFTREALERLCLSDTALGYGMMRNLALDLAFKLRHQNLDS